MAASQVEMEGLLKMNKNYKTEVNKSKVTLLNSILDKIKRCNL